MTDDMLALGSRRRALDFVRPHLPRVNGGRARADGEHDDDRFQNQHLGWGNASSWPLSWLADRSALLTRGG